MGLAGIIPIRKHFGKTTRPFIIAGPCSAETREQVLATARAISSLGLVSLMRAGIWKPRSRPDSFEGVGERGLDWLCEARALYGMPFITEVANPSHVEAVLGRETDAIWIGARTTVNPFYVQEIVNALKGVDIPVFIKNPVSPDAALWIGAIERFYKAGIRKIAAIHRGFTPAKKGTFRNEPLWEIPIGVKVQIPEMDIICDPSHIGGNRELLFPIAQKAMDLNMAGLMIETHLHPETARSDAKQQITPKALEELLHKLPVRTADCQTGEFNSKLEKLRREIDKTDAGLLEYFSKRMAFVDQIGAYKLENNVTVFQLKRWKEILSTRVAYGTELGLKEDFIRKMLQLIHKESIRRQMDIMNNETVTENGQNKTMEN